MVYHILVVGESDHGVSLGHVALFDFLRRHFSVGYCGMAVEVGLEESAFFREQMYFHVGLRIRSVSD